jgi:hypothetical protein
MRFQILSTVVAALTVSTASAQLSPQQVVDTIKKVTDLSSSTADIAEDLGSNPISLIPNGFVCLTPSINLGPKKKKHDTRMMR